MATTKKTIQIDRPPSALLQAQWKFMRMVPLLIAKAHEMGFEVTLGDGYRDPRAFGEMNSLSGPYGAARSAHKQRLAIDLNLFLNGRLVTATAGHQKLGEFWESLGGNWGGRFRDGNHYSLMHDGIV